MKIMQKFIEGITQECHLISVTIKFIIIRQQIGLLGSFL